MKERDKLLRYFEASGSGEEAVILLDMVSQVLSGRPYRVSHFVSPVCLSIAEAIRAHYPQIVIQVSGGYDRAERVQIAFVDAHYEGNVDFDLSAVSVTWDPRFRLLTHRDVLGSLMGLGIEREMIGDILMVSGGAQIITTKSMASFLEQEFVKIAMVKVSTAPLALSEIQPKEERIKEIKTTVASLRLDAVASSGFSMSRTKLVEAVQAGLLQVNWKSAKGPAQEVKEGDVISMRGRGRMVVEEVVGTSRKGRTIVHLKRFI